MKRMLAHGLLSLTLSATLGSALAQSPTHPYTKTQNQYHVIIIGAGIAGLETAHYLQEHGETNFIVLEARNRIGGRTWTLQPKNPAWKGAYLDMGAAWIHGAGADNPIMQLANKLHLGTTLSDSYSADVFQANGKPFSDAANKRSVAQFEAFSHYLKNAHSHITPQTSQLSVSDAALAFIKKHHLNRQQQTSLLAEISLNIEQEYGADMTKLSMLWFNADGSFNGPERVFDKGYQGIVNYLAANIQDKIRLNQKVAQVDYRNKNAIRVTTANGKTYTAQYVVSTLPIGVLQKGIVKFIPRLPENKQIAIHKHINMGLFNKVNLIFPKAFWHSKEFIERIPNAYWNGRVWKNKGRWIEFVNMNYYAKEPILTALITGNFAKHVQHMSKQAAVTSIMNILRNIYGHNIPSPTSVIMTHWGQDPYAFGAYTSLRPGALPHGRDYVEMGKPVNDNLIFAGEGTTSSYPGTVHGAYLTGVRAGKHIIHGAYSADYDQIMDDDSTYMYNMFNTTPIYNNKQGQGDLEFTPSYNNERTYTDTIYSVSADMGITDHLLLEASWDAHDIINSKEGEPTVSGSGDVSASLQYHPNAPFLWHNLQAAAGVQMKYPTGDIDKGLTNGLMNVGPYLILQQAMPQLDNLQLYSFIGYDFVTRKKKPTQPSDPEEDRIPLAPNANEFSWNNGFFLPIGHFRFSTVVNWTTSRWHNDGKINTVFITPGVLWQGKHIEAGLAAPLGLNKQSGDSVIFVVGLYNR